MDQPAQHYDHVWPSNTNGGIGLGWRPLLLSVIVAIAGVMLSFLFSWLLLRQEQRLAAAQFRYDAARRVETIQRAVTDRLSALNTLAVYYAGSELVERDEFRTFVKPLLEKRPGIMALGWAPRILTGQRQAYEQSLRKEGISNWQITERNGQGRFVPSGRRVEYWPVLFIEPAAENKSFFGFDIGSNPTYRKALQRATASGEPAAGVCRPRIRDAQGNPLVYVVMPAKNDTSGAAKRPANQPAVDGFVFGLFDIGPIVESSLRSVPAVGIDVAIVAPSSMGGEELLCTRPSPLRAARRWRSNARWAICDSRARSPLPTAAGRSSALR